MTREVIIKFSQEITENANLTLKESAQFLLDIAKYNLDENVKVEVINAEDVEKVK